MGQWSSGYDVALTTRRSPVQFRPGPLLSLCKNEVKFSSVEIEDFLRNFVIDILMRIEF